MLKRIFAKVLFVSLLFPMGANAALVTWTFSGWFFDDFSTAEGTFDFDATLGAFSNVSITTTPGILTGLPGSSYTSVDSAGVTSSAGRPFIFLYDDDADTELNIMFGSPLTNAGGTVSIYYGAEIDYGDGGSRALYSGQTITGVPAVPVPAAGWLFISALGGLVARKKLAKA